MKHLIEVTIDEKLVKEFFKSLPLRKKMALISTILNDNMPIVKEKPMVNWSLEDKARAKRLYEVALKTPREIAKLLNRPENTVIAYLKDECGFILPGVLGKKPKRDNSAIIADINSGMSVVEIANKHHCSRQHVYTTKYLNAKEQSISQTN